MSAALTRLFSYGHVAASNLISDLATHLIITECGRDQIMEDYFNELIQKPAHWQKCQKSAVISIKSHISVRFNEVITVRLCKNTAKSLLEEKSDWQLANIIVLNNVTEMFLFLAETFNSEVSNKTFLNPAIEALTFEQPAVVATWKGR